MFKLAPSILAADFSKLGEQIHLVEAAGADELHIDVMDGIFVPSISFGMPVIQSIRGVSKMFFDVHLMITEPVRYLEEFVKAGADGITVHAEACSDLKETVKRVKEAGVKVGVSIKPDTPISVLEDVEPYLDRVLVMTVNPGFGGQKLIPECVEKVRELAKHRSSCSFSYDIQVDGGIGLSNVREVADAGAEVFVAGTAVFRGNILQNVKAFKEEVGVAD
ncbi:MAG: ribulose-phosphate 3-epimerase [Lachnospiraceae bacterium]|nr:ribulose-phosphate 3-epimerase [Lachnospiraceae bacterium]